MDNFVEYVINDEEKKKKTEFKTVYEDTESYGEELSRPKEVSDIVNRQAALEALREIITVNKNQVLELDPVPTTLINLFLKTNYHSKKP